MLTMKEVAERCGIKVLILFILFFVLNKISTFLFNTKNKMNIFCIFATV